ncbi:hypothetical protein GCM10027341_12780 [Spirosoma knui]
MKHVFTLLLLVTSWLSYSTQAQSIWTGASSTDWNTAANWDPVGVPTATSDVVIPAVFNDPVISTGTSALAKTVEVRSSGSLTISSSATLTVGGNKAPGDYPFYNIAFYNNGLVANRGLLSIDPKSSDTFGLFNTGAFTNYAGGEIQTDNTGTSGLANWDEASTFINAGHILIGFRTSGEVDGLLNDGTFTNEPGGLIEIERTFRGIINRIGTSTFTNAGHILIGASAASESISSGVYNRANFTNNATGEIQIGRVTSDGLQNVEGTFINAGRILIGANAAVGRYGLQNIDGSFTNSMGGLIQIDRSTMMGLFNGQIAGKPANDGSFTNAGTITIGASAAVGEYGLYNRMTFNNNAGGLIQIDRSSLNGLYNDKGTFTNSARIVIGANAPVGDNGLRNEATFNNNVGGQIQIDRSTQSGLLNQYGTFTNAASISIGTNASVGEYGLTNRNIFSNTTGGQIQIDKTNLDGLLNIGNSFTNSANIVIGATIGRDGLANSFGTVTNTACASLSVLASVSNTETFTNQGLLTVSTTRANVNTGTFTNNGVIAYPQGNPIPNVTNNKLIALPLTTNCDLIASPALQIGASNDLTVGSNWYQDAALSNLAGTYSPNSFIATNLTPGATSPVYFQVSGLGDGCSQTVSIPVTVQAAPQAKLDNSGIITCTNPAVTLTASPAEQSSYVFSGPSSFTQSGTSAVASVTASGTYSVTVTNASGCSTTATVEVTGNTTVPQNITLTNNGPLSCSQTSVTLTAASSSGSLSYSFTGPSSSPIIQNGSAVASVTAGGTYTVTVTGTNGCSTTATTEVASNTIPPSLSLSNSGPLSFTNTTVTLTATATPGATYSYRFSPGAAQQGSSNMATVNTTGVYSATATRLDNGCSATASTTVTGGNNPTVCRGGAAVINVTVDGDPVKYEWYKNSLTTPKIMETPQLFRGTATSSLTLINAQSSTQGNFFLKVTDRSGTVKIYGPYRLTVDGSCRAREVAQLETPLQVELAPNPISGERLRAVIRGAEGRPLEVNLVDLSGKSIRQQRWSEAQPEQPVEWDLQTQGSGVYLLQVVSGASSSGPAQQQSLKVIKP